MSNEIIKVLDYVGEKFGLAIDWTSAEVIPYITMLGEKIVAYEFWTSILLLLFGCALLIPALKARRIYRWWSRIREEDQFDWCDYDYKDCGVFIIILIIAMALISFMFIGIQLSDILACLTFPEKIIVEYIKAAMPK